MRMRILLTMSIILLLLLPAFTICPPTCSEGQALLDSVQFLECKKSVFADLTARGYYISRLVQTDWKAPEGSISVCQYMGHLWQTCLPVYSGSGCRSAAEVARLEEMWVRQAVSDTEIYGAQGELLSCNETREVFNRTEIEKINLMLEDKEHWHQKSSNCQFLYAYNSGQYNHNLDKIIRCNSKCDPEEQLPTPFPMFTEEKAHINDKMNLSITKYSKCLTDVGVTTSQVKSNLTEATWDTSEDTKWSTCASLKTFVRNCSSILGMCLDQEHAEVVLAEDFHNMVGMIDEGLVEKRGIFGDFKVKDCDIFGGHVSGVEELAVKSWALVLILTVFGVLFVVSI
eukprot:GFUD01042846.1.p1 GENE.GFUD01042846.1~~GFUD01042846.1.p1  ORF type:complete len:342 (+),score=92.04 GFUD01042846.1:248-1273(+)